MLYFNYNPYYRCQWYHTMEASNCRRWLHHNDRSLYQERAPGNDY